LSLITVVDTMVVATDDAVGIDSTSEAAASSVVTTLLYTDATGAATYTVTAADPSALTTNYNRTEHTVVVTPTIGSATTFTVAFDDNPAINQSVTVALGASYGAGLATGVSRSATATVRDQYGNGMASKTVTFESSSTNSAVDPFTDDVTRITDSSGVATLGYTSLKTATAAVTVYAWLDNGLTKDGASSGTANTGGNDTPGAGGELDGNAVFYRTTAQVSSVAEVDTAPATEIGGEGDDALVSASGVWTVVAHGLVAGDEFVVRTEAAAPEGILIGKKLFVLVVTDADTFTVSETRGGTAFDPGGAVVDSGSHDLEIAKLGTADVAADVLMELVINDSANDTLVINHLAGANATSTFVTFAYDSNDQFQTVADIAAPTAATMAAFETAVAGKFSALGVPTAGMSGDVYSLSYQATTTGIQIVRLGQ